MRALLLAALLALVAPAVASAANGATIEARDLPVGGARTTAGATAPSVFDLVGFHWQGSGTVLFRTHAVTGRWSSWRPVAPEADDLPDPGSREGRLRRGWRLGSPYWVGASDRVAYRVVGDVRRLRAWYVWSPVEGIPLRTTAMTGSPKIVLRRAWGANEEITRGAPRYARAVSFAVVHHTAGSNAYTRSQSAAIVRGIELYHVRGNGWNDIGYNFLVDKYGQVFEGRAGGIERNVIGAHAQGFNTGSTGIAVIGNYTATRISAAAMQALVGLLAWRLDVAHVDPLSTLSWRSGGNPRVPGRPRRDTARDLGPPRHRPHQLPRRRPLLQAARHRAAGCRDGAAEAVCAAGTGRPRRADPVHGQALGSRGLGGDRQGRFRRGGRARSRHRNRSRLDVECRSDHGRLVHLDDRGRAADPPGVRDDRQGATVTAAGSVADPHRPGRHTAGGLSGRRRDRRCAGASPTRSPPAPP